MKTIKFSIHMLPVGPKIELTMNGKCNSRFDLRRENKKEGEIRFDSKGGRRGEKEEAVKK